MKKLISAIFFSVGMATVLFAADAEIGLKSEKDKMSYSIGQDFGSKMKEQSVDIDLNILVKGLRDGYGGERSLLTEKEVTEALTALQKELRSKQEERQKVMGQKNRKEGAVFLEENRKKEGVVALPSGLQYKVLLDGSGKKPGIDDTVVVHYRGTLVDGTEFDSSYKHGQPATFPLKGIIPGWTEAVQLMKEGSKWQLFIPSELAYGERGAGNVIGPNATLIFEVELISIKK